MEVTSNTWEIRVPKLRSWERGCWEGETLITECAGAAETTGLSQVMEQWKVSLYVVKCRAGCRSKGDGPRGQNLAGI